MSSRLTRCLLLLLLALPGIGPGPCPTAEAQGLRHEAGFMTLEPVSFHFHHGSFESRLQLRSSEARIWYSFQVADHDPETRPLFVFFNGGPGAAVSSGLMSMYTSRYTLDNRLEPGGGNGFIPNPYSWTRLANLLYLDPRQTGFSYGVMPDVDDPEARFREFNAQNFNGFSDGADFVRILLRFLAAHPPLRDNPIVIVGESYGGVRATVMLHLLLNYADYGDGTAMYQDPGLAEEVQAHLERVFPEYQGRVVPADVVSRQFGHQVLVQPALSMGYQNQVTREQWRRPGSVLYGIGQEVGIPYDPQSFPDALGFVDEVAERDVYMYTKPAGWVESYFGNAGRLLRFTRNLSLMTGTDVTQIRQLHASSRADAYRVYDVDYGGEWDPEEVSSLDAHLFLRFGRTEALQTVLEPGDMESVFGVLQPWDRYFLGLNIEANWAFHFFNVAWQRGYEVHYRLPRFGRMFLQNVEHVRTFVTHAALDLVVWGEAIPPALALHTDVLTDVHHERWLPAGAARPGQIRLEYASAAGTRTVRFPLYATSGHAVSLTQPQGLFHDVSHWLSGAGPSPE